MCLSAAQCPIDDSCLTHWYWQLISAGHPRQVGTRFGWLAETGKHIGHRAYAGFGQPNEARQRYPFKSSKITTRMNNLAVSDAKLSAFSAKDGVISDGGCGSDNRQWPKCRAVTSFIDTEVEHARDDSTGVAATSPAQPGASRHGVGAYSANVRMLVWILCGLTASVLFHARLAGWVVAPDLPLALVAWAVVCGDTHVWMLRVWIIGPLRDLVDPGSQWFHAGAHLLLVAALIPLRRWIPSNIWIALLAVGVGASLSTQALDVVISGRGGWDVLIGITDAALTGLLAMVFGWLVPKPKRTVTIDEADAGPAPEDQPVEATGR